MARNFRNAAAWAGAGGLAIGGLANTGAAQAHNVWMTTTTSGGQTTAQVLYGDVIGPELADLKKIVSLDLVSPTGKVDLRAGLAKASARGFPILKTGAFRAAKGGVLAVAYDNGFWVRLPGDKLETNTSPLMAPGAAEPHWTVKYGKMLLGPGSHGHILHTRLELVPLRDPYLTAIGGTAPVRLELDGKPFSGAKIAYTDGLKAIPDEKQPTLTTGADGVIQLPIDHKGAYLLTVDINAPPKHASLAAKDHLYASLAFDTSR
jgi:uncharacterized GH25 family protein